MPLSGAARRRWDELAGARDWKPRQLATLAAYCAHYGRWFDAEAWLADPAHGPVITIRDDKGNVKTHGPAPQLRIAEQAGKEAHRLAAILNL